MIPGLWFVFVLLFSVMRALGRMQLSTLAGVEAATADVGTPPRQTFLSPSLTIDCGVSVLVLEVWLKHISSSLRFAGGSRIAQRLTQRLTSPDSAKALSRFRAHYSAV